MAGQEDEKKFPSEQHLQARLELANTFLLTVVVPYVLSLSAEETLTAAKLTEMENKFKEQYRLIGSDFTIDHVWGMAWAFVEDAQLTGTTFTEKYRNMERAWQAITTIQAPQGK